MPRSRRPLHARRASFLSLSLTFVFCGLALLWPVPSSPFHNPAETQAYKPVIQIDPALTKTTSFTSLNPPQRIIIPNLNLDLKITESPIINGYWQLSETTASHGIGSADPGQKGNIVIFAHARPGLFLPLRQAQKGMLVYLLSQYGWRGYTIDSLQLVNPTQIEVIKPTGFETLTLYTCSGFADTQRLIVRALPQ